MPCFYLITGADQELELAAAELGVLAGCGVQGRVGTGQVGVDVSRAAYTRFCAEQLAAAPNLGELVAEVRRLQPDCDGFRIEVHRPAPKVPASRTEIVKSIADCLPGRPNLDNPRTELAVVVSPGCWRLGRIISRSNQGWRRQSRRLHNYSFALTAQMARALVNLAAAPGDRLLDPCCGVGTAVAEALVMGVRAVGADVNPKVAGLAAENLRSLQLPSSIAVADARTIAGNFVAAVVDFPYGHSSSVDPDLYADILLNLRTQVRRLVLVMAEPQDELLASVGLRIVYRARVSKRTLTRHIYLTAPVRRESASAGETLKGGSGF